MDEINPTILKTTIESIPILTEENFSSWRTRITALFKLGGLKDQILNGEPALDESDNTIVCAIIIAKLSPVTHSNVVTADNEDNALELWKAIAKRFISSEPSNRARVYNVFNTISFDISNIEKFITEVRSSLVKMVDVGIQMPPDIITYYLLARLPPSLDNIKQAITHSRHGEDITPEKLLDHLEIHLNEMKVSATSRKPEAVTMFTEKSKRCAPGKHNPLADHPFERCWFNSNKANAPWVKRQESNVSSFSTFTSVYPSVFILDSGSTSHMVSDRGLFISLDETEGGLINTSCGSNSLRIEGRGSISVSCCKRPQLFHNVLYVPNITVNLLSLRQLLLEKYEIEFKTNHFSVTNTDGTVLKGHYHNNLPVIRYEPLKHSSNLSQAELLHKSLGHVSYSRIRNKLGIRVKPPNCCKACSVSKITRASYKHRSSRASKAFEEIHLDLIGPFSTISHEGHRYILTIVDAFSRFCSAIPIKAKSDVFLTLTSVIASEAKRFGYHPSIIHSDRGTEFINTSLEDYCRRNIIRQRFSDAYTPQQNGLAERFNRTILEALRTILVDSGFRLNLWNEVIGACLLTLNQIPSHRSKPSPFELFKGYSVALDFFHPIGNPTVVYSDQKKDKLDP